jgi:hypothetical protein
MGQTPWATRLTLIGCGDAADIVGLTWTHSARSRGKINKGGSIQKVVNSDLAENTVPSKQILNMNLLNTLLPEKSPALREFNCLVGSHTRTALLAWTLLKLPALCIATGKLMAFLGWTAK